MPGKILYSECAKYARSYGEVIEEDKCWYQSSCYLLQSSSITFQKPWRKALTPRKSHKQHGKKWTEVLSLNALTVISNLNFCDWYCYHYIVFITLEHLLIKIFHNHILFFKHFCFYLSFLNSFISFLESNNITCYFPQHPRKKLCQGITECSLTQKYIYNCWLPKFYVGTGIFVCLCMCVLWCLVSLFFWKV